MTTVYLVIFWIWSTNFGKNFKVAYYLTNPSIDFTVADK